MKYKGCTSGRKANKIGKFTCNQDRLFSLSSDLISIHTHTHTHRVLNDSEISTTRDTFVYVHNSKDNHF